MECRGMGAAAPTTLFEITLGEGPEKDYYDVSIVDGYNLPLMALPDGVNGRCNVTGCTMDLNSGINSSFLQFSYYRIQSRVPNELLSFFMVSHATGCIRSFLTYSLCYIKCFFPLIFHRQEQTEA